MAAGSVKNIQGPVTVIGDGSDTLNIDDAAAQAQIATLTSTSLTGLGMG